jgi:hypothetical protein
MRVAFRSAGAVAVALAAVIGSEPGAAGARVVGSAAGPARHCVVWIAPTSGRAPSRISGMRCFASMTAAMRVARGRAPASFAGRGGRGRIASASTLISTDYGQGNFAGDSLTWTVSNSSGCAGGGTYQAASMPSGWNDRVSSSKSAGGCAENDHFQNTNFLGSAITCTCATMGSLNNETSSETWSQ